MLHREQQDRCALILRFFNNMDRFRCLRFLHEPFVTAQNATFIMNLPSKKLMAAFGCHGILKPGLYNPHKY
ncbi:MAG: hypothetical protein KAT27_07525 [Desulfobacterales bacterium]|nr:hypothetical protein [Desulfobacterales bacterium]